MSGDGNYEEAFLISVEVKFEAYFIAGNNCMDETDRILRAFGVENLPLPLTSFTPSNYFNRVNHPLQKLHKTEGTEVVQQENKIKTRGSQQLLSPVMDALAEQLEMLEKRIPHSTHGPEENKADQKLAKFISLMQKAVKDFRGRCGSIKVDNKDILQNTNEVEATLQNLNSQSSKELLKQIKQRVAEGVKESDWRKEINSNPLQSEKMPIHPDLSIDTVTGWAELDYHFCKDESCCKN
jgi:hypothetical protein